MRSRIVYCIPLVAGMLTASHAHAQGIGASSPGASLAAAQDAVRSWDQRPRSDVLAVLDSARAANLPVDVLAAKVVEGANKGASPERIVRVVYETFTTMRSARAALGSDRSPGEIAAGGGALRAGLSTSDLQRIKGASRNRPVIESLVVATDMVRRGVPAADAVGAVVRLAESGADGEMLLQFQADVAQDVAAGVAPRSAALERARVLSTRPGSKSSRSVGRPLSSDPANPQ